MKQINPYGRIPQNGVDISPRACICNIPSNNAYDILEKFGQGSNCACTCSEAGNANSIANSTTAINW